MANLTISGNLVFIEEKKISFGTISIAGGKIASIIIEGDEKDGEPYILPGFTDSHVHIESSMLVPSQFARLAVVHGTVATISDPHEIANVCGLEGVRYMIKDGKSVPFKFHFGAPSCVPATDFETAGARLTAADVDLLLQHEDIYYLSEMMNFPGVLHEDAEVMAKIASSKKYGKPVDGHAPGLRGEDARKYISAGIQTDHECFTRDEALDKLGYGMKILIREGSAAKNFEALAPLLNEYSAEMMFCTDDKHPDSLAEGHINVLCARAITKGIDVFRILQAACINPVKHYRMRNGLMQEGDAADLAVVKNLVEFAVLETYIDGVLVAKDGRPLIQTDQAEILNNFSALPVTVKDFESPGQAGQMSLVIEALDGQLITNKVEMQLPVIDGFRQPDLEHDVVKIAVVNRYSSAPLAVAFIKNTGINSGALASSVAHDSHNIVAIGVDDDSLCRAVNLVIAQRGGISAVKGGEEKILALPVAGLMSNEDGYDVAAAYTEMDKFAKDEMGSRLSAPYMTASFMALLVIPHLKLSDKGLFDGDSFSFTN
ncbi:MAG: adenine deaminase [Ferruginibacter sp.]